MENINEFSNKIDPSIGLLTNVPTQLLNNLLNTFNLEDKDKIIEVIILYRDSPDIVRKSVENLGGEFIDLGYNFGVVKIKLEKLQELSRSPSLQYIELPKNLMESDFQNNVASCIPKATSTYNLSGEGIVVGFVDSGIDYMHPAFRNEDGSTRIEYIYDLSLDGAIYDKKMINDAIKSENPYLLVPSIDNTGHGTHIVGISCGNGKISKENYGVAPKSSIIMVKAMRGAGALSSQVMQGIKFIIDKGKELNMPVVINLSLSTNNGAHNGSSLLEQYIRTIANLERITICIASGNEGDAAHHVGKDFIGTLDETFKETFNIANDESIVSMNFYKSILPDVSLKLENPIGDSVTIVVNEGYFQGGIGKDRYDIYISGPKPFELESEVKIILTTRSSYLIGGVWSLTINALNTYEGNYSIWLPVSEGINKQTRFLQPDNFNTLGIPATVNNVISVGSYNYRTRTLSSFSGRGKENSYCTVKPDIVAPGENVVGPVPNGGYDPKTGTSMASPQVAGISALLMEWGLIKGNDPYLYGQRLKSYLIKGAARTRLDINYPNPAWGYGTVCLFDSLNILENVLNKIRSYSVGDFNYVFFRDIDKDNLIYNEVRTINANFMLIDYKVK